MENQFKSKSPTTLSVSGSIDHDTMTVSLSVDGEHHELSFESYDEWQSIEAKGFLYDCHLHHEEEELSFSIYSLKRTNHSQFPEINTRDHLCVSLKEMGCYQKLKPSNFKKQTVEKGNAL